MALEATQPVTKELRAQSSGRGMEGVGENGSPSPGPLSSFLPASHSPAFCR